MTDDHCSAHEQKPHSNACCAEPTAAAAPDCHASAQASCCPDDTATQKRPDWILWGSALLVAAGYSLHLIAPGNVPQWLHHYSMGAFDLMNAMWWGLAVGVIFVGLLSRVPRESVMRILGPGGSWRGLFRATAAGVLLDLCSHGILAVGAKLYERGASAGQVMAFLIASPWNSISLTLILVGLIGLGWTVLFTVLSLLLALTTGRMFDMLVRRGTLPGNPHDVPADVATAPGPIALLRDAKWSANGLSSLLLDGVRGARMVIRWALFGVVLAALIRAFVPADLFQNWFGPTLLGLAATIVAATIIEVCSEGSVPIAADLFNRAAAPGNAFAFLMAGVATDYTEVMVVRDTTRSWRIALFLPLLTLPQVILLAWIINLAAT